MTRLATKDAPSRITAALATVQATGEPAAFEKDGKAVAVLVSAEDFALLERLREAEEDRIDAAAGDRILDDSSPEDFEPWEKVKADLGL